MTGHPYFLLAEALFSVTFELSEEPINLRALLHIHIDPHEVIAKGFALLRQRP